MSQYLAWLLLSLLTRSPVLSAVFLLVFWFAVDRFTVGLLPDPFRFISRARRRARLREQLRVSPHDRKARMELSALLVEAKRYEAAVQLLRGNLEAGDDDINTVFVMGVACLGAGHLEQGEKLLAHVEQLQPDFRVGEVHLQRGRFALARRDFVAARAALEQLVRCRKGSIEGRVLLARALEGQGDDGAAALMADQAWDEYVVAPRFVRRKERWWAYRARPSRPALYGGAVLLALLLLGRFAAPPLAHLVQQHRAPDEPADE